MDVDSNLPIVIKRDGNKQAFDISKIERAISAAMTECGVDPNGRVSEIANKATTDIINRKLEEIAVEEIQDIVESMLMVQYPQVARAYVIWRERRSKARDQRLVPDSKIITDYIVLSKYSRYSEYLQRRELWPEAVNRVELMHKKKYPHIKKQISEAFNYVRDLKVLPAMRTLQYGGVAMDTNNCRGYNCTFSVANRRAFFSEGTFLLLSGCGVGFSAQKHHVSNLPSIKYIDKHDVKHYIIPDSIEGWADAIDELMMSYMTTGRYVEFAYNRIRDEGEPLVTSGGKAPGHLGLKKAIDNVRNILDQAQGRKLRPIEVLDIMCHIAGAVVSGGVRRSAMICIFDSSDDEMMTAKTRKNYDMTKDINTQRRLVNISAVIDRNSAKKDEYSKVFEYAKELGEPGIYFTSNKDFGPNPCGEILLAPYIDMTPELIEEAKTLGKSKGYKVPKDIRVGQRYWGWGFCNLGAINMADCKSIVDVVDRARAAALICTLQAGYTHFPYLGWVTELLSKTDSLIGVSMSGMMDNPEIAFDPEIQNAAAYAVKETNMEIAQKIGIRPSARSTCIKPAGCRPKDALTTTDMGILTLEELFEEHETGKTTCIVNKDINAITLDNNKIAKTSIIATHDVGKQKMIKVKLNYGLELECTDNHKWWVLNRINEETRKEEPMWIEAKDLVPGDALRMSALSYSRKYNASLVKVEDEYIEDHNKPSEIDNHIGWLLGYMWRNHNVVITPDYVSIKIMIEHDAKKAYRVLIRGLGINIDDISVEYYKVNIENPSDPAKLYNLNIKGSYFTNWLQENGFIHEIDNHKLMHSDLIPIQIRTSSRDVIISFIAGYLDNNGFIGKHNDNLRLVTSFTIGEREVANHVQHVCWAIGIPLALEKIEDYFDDHYVSVIKAYVVMQLCNPLSITSFINHCNKMEYVDEMHIGGNDIILPGVVHEIEELEPKQAYDIETEDHTFLHGAFLSHNTESLVFGCIGAGIHTHHARRYFRRVIANPNEPVYKFFKQYNPHMCVNTSTFEDVITFCVQAPDNAFTREDVSAIKFLEAVTLTQENWVKSGGGTSLLHGDQMNSISYTLTIKEHEWNDVKEYIWKHKNILAGVTLFHFIGDKEYVNAPREAVVTEADEAKWNEIVSNYKDVPYELMIEHGDNTTFQQESACSGGQCEL